MAILARTRRALAGIEELLEQRSIPVRIGSNAKKTVHKTREVSSKQSFDLTS